MRSGKGGKDRVTLLPQNVCAPLRQHLVEQAKQHSDACLRGAGYAPLPHALAHKYPNAARQWKWQYVFTSPVKRVDPVSGHLQRWYMSPSTLQRAFRDAVIQSNVHKHATVHTLRHRFATHLLQSSVDIRTIQSLMRHSSLETTMVYTHVVSTQHQVRSPLDNLG